MKIITLPCQRQVTLAAYVAAIRAVKRNPGGCFAGWDYLPTAGRHIISDFGRLVTDMVNKSMTMPEDRRGANARLLKRLQRDGRECRWCGARFTPADLNAKWCCGECRKAYYS